MAVYAISDVEGDSISTIGSGIGDCYRARAKASSSIIASNQIARDKAAETAIALGFEVKQNQESLYDDIIESIGYDASPTESFTVLFDSQFACVIT